MAVELKDYSLSDEKTGRLLFETISDEKVLTGRIRTTLSRLLTQGSFLSVLRFVSRYLLRYRNPIEVSGLLTKYIVVIIYNCLFEYDLIKDEK